MLIIGRKTIKLISYKETSRTLNASGLNRIPRNLYRKNNIKITFNKIANISLIY
jgi:hypothetical protein